MKRITLAILMFIAFVFALLCTSTNPTFAGAVIIGGEPPTFSLTCETTDNSCNEHRICISTDCLRTLAPGAIHTTMDQCIVCGGDPVITVIRDATCAVSQECL